ncbi:MAG: acyl-CoA dehydrogenase family protein [Chloroflexota bacterium]
MTERTAEFGLSEAHLMLRDNVRQFVRRELLATARKRAKQDFVEPWVVRRLGEMGLLGINMPEEYGGQPGDSLSAGIAAEEVARGNMSESILFTYPTLLHAAIKTNPGDFVHEWLTPVCRGETIIAFGNTEPGCGSDAAAIETKAVREGDHYLIKGEKTAVTMGMQAKAFYITAKTATGRSPKTITAFLVPADMPGVVRSHIPYSGCKSYGSASLILDNVRLHERYRLGQEGQAFYLAMEFFDFARVILCLMTLGAAAVSLEEAIEYAKQRRAFGQPIARWEGVSFQLAEAATLLEAARMMSYRPLWLRDQGRRHSKETAMAKWWVPQVAGRIIHHCILVCGHTGYSEEFGLEQRLRDVVGHELADGTAQIQKVVITRELLGRDYLPY